MENIAESQPVRLTGVHDVGGLDIDLPLNLEEKPLAFWERQVLAFPLKSHENSGPCNATAAATACVMVAVAVCDNRAQTGIVPSASHSAAR